MSSIIAGGPRAADGAPVVAPTATAYSEYVTRFVGARYVCDPGASEHDLKVTTPVLLQGGSYWVEGANNGDSVSLAVVGDKDVTLDEIADVDRAIRLDADGVALDTTARERGGVEYIEYVVDLPVAPWAHQQDLIAATAGSVPLGARLRVTYTNVGEKPVTLGVLYRWLQPPA